MRVMMMDFKARKANPSIFYCIALFVFNWVGFALLILFLGLMTLDGCILILRLIKVLS